MAKEEETERFLRRIDQTEEEEEETSCCLPREVGRETVVVESPPLFSPPPAKFEKEEEEREPAAAAAEEETPLLAVWDSREQRESSIASYQDLMLMMSSLTPFCAPGAAKIVGRLFRRGM